MEDTNDTNPISTKLINTRAGRDKHTIQRSKKLIEQHLVPIKKIKQKGSYLIDKEYWPNSKNSARYLEIETNIELLKGAFIKKVFS